MPAYDPPRVAVIGGSGLCRQDIFAVVDEVKPITQAGSPSDVIQVCRYQDAAGRDRTLAFLPRHGDAHHP